MLICEGSLDSLLLEEEEKEWMNSEHAIHTNSSHKLIDLTDAEFILLNALKDRVTVMRIDHKAFYKRHRIN